MRDSLSHRSSLIVIALLGLFGCTGSEHDAAPSPATASPQAAAAPKPARDDGIPPEHFDTILKEHYRGLGLIERYNFEEAAVAFGKVHELAPRWIPGSINLAIALMNQVGRDGVAMSRALQILDEVIARSPDNLHAHFCRGLIYETTGLLIQAHADFRFVTEKDPSDAHAWYKRGLTVDVDTASTVGRGGETSPIEERRDEQLADFKRALECNPYLSAVVYKLAFAYRQMGDQDRTRKLIDLWKQLEKGRDGIRVGEELSNIYGDQGRYARVINPLAEQAALSTPFRPPHFDPPIPLNVHLAERERWVTSADFAGRLAVIGRARARFGAPVVAFDADGDGRTDLFLPASVAGPQGVRDALLLNRGEGAFEDATKRWGFPVDRAGLGAAAGDFDGDGRVDLVLTGIGEIHLLHNEGPGGFKDVTDIAGIIRAPALSLTARWLDLDQDGDLDLYVINYTGLNHLNRAFSEATPPGYPNSAYRNDGKPAPIPGVPPGDQAPKAMALYHPEKATGGLSIKMTPWPGPDALLGGDAPHTGLAMLDLDDDRDLDLVLASEGAAPQALLNDRLGQFHPASIQGLEPRVADAGLLVTELDKDGRPDLVTVDSAGKTTAWRNQCRRVGADLTIVFERWPCNVKGWRGALTGDIDLDGWPDLLGLSSSDGLPIPGWARNDGRRLSSMSLPLGPDGSEGGALQVVALADLVGDLLPDLLVIKEGDVPRLARNRGNGHHWLALRLAGKWASWGRLRSNPHGIGARIWLQGPHLDVTHDAAVPGIGLAQSCDPITLGLGTNDSAAVVRCRWPDGVNQCELNVPVDQPLTLVEKTHRVSTCPILFAWDGRRYQCVGDLLDGGGLGYYLAPGVWSVPDRDEAVAIDGNQLQMSDGTYHVIITEPMDEVAYLDHLTLDVVDRPPGVSTTPDERFAAGDKRPTGQLVAWKTSVEPVRATDLSGHDLTETLRAWDRRSADGFKRLEGWNGYSEGHGIVLDFGNRLSGFDPSDRLFLCLAGWVEFPFSQTNYAASTAGIPLRLPVLERQQADGSWKLLEADPGCPSGLPKLSTLELTGKLDGPNCVIRLRTDLECYWDQAFVAILDPAPGIRVTSLPVARADLAYRGYTVETSPDGRMPMLYDYDTVVPMPLTRMSGHLTRYGDVTPLLRSDDDQLCLVGPGDEVRVEFDSKPAPSLPAGWTRSYVLRAVGYCKDADLFTATGDTVEPLPWRGMSSYPFGPEGQRPMDPAYEEYLRKYQTRSAGNGWQDGRGRQANAAPARKDAR
jgi:tetratricopeptide (TPR) repeat protein